MKAYSFVHVYNSSTPPPSPGSFSSSQAHLVKIWKVRPWIGAQKFVVFLGRLIEKINDKFLSENPIVSRENSCGKFY